MTYFGSGVDYSHDPKYTELVDFPIVCEASLLFTLCLSLQVVGDLTPVYTLCSLCSNHMDLFAILENHIQLSHDRFGFASLSPQSGLFFLQTMIVDSFTSFRPLLKGHLLREAPLITLP